MARRLTISLHDGGTGYSDDMAELDYSGRIHVAGCRSGASAAREKTNGCPAGDELPLTGMLWLGRSETGRGEIVPRRNEHGEKQNGISETRH